MNKLKDYFGNIWNGKYDEDVPDYGTVMTVNQFIESVKGGIFIDYDGYGRPIKNKKAGNCLIYPSIIKYIPHDATHIVWFNR